ncbi:hypothetical protein D3C72_1501700 [compost metagenome]
MSETVLEDRKHTATGLLDGVDQRVGLFQRADQRLFADHILARSMRLQRDREMQVRRQADVDELDALVGQNLIEIGGQTNGGIIAGDGAGALQIEIADRLDDKAFGQCAIAAQMLGADAGANDGNTDHFETPSALACA